MKLFNKHGPVQCWYRRRRHFGWFRHAPRYTYAIRIGEYSAAVAQAVYLLDQARESYDPIEARRLLEAVLQHTEAWDYRAASS